MGKAGPRRREPIIGEARRQKLELAATDAVRVAADPDDRREIARVQALTDELSSEPGRSRLYREAGKHGIKPILG